ncbi:MAG TPA: glycosyltransferase family 4 protein [Roseiflexaceae bacterium]|nr:glycosyltransferase family 4 protein [Roseiflexaceae bacterium]
MRVLMVSQDFPPRIYGGIGRHVGALVEALRRSGVDVTVITTTWLNPRSSDDGPAVIRVDRAGPPVPLFEGAHVWSPIDMLQFNIAMAAEGCRSADFDLVHCHDMFSVLAGHVIAAMHGRPLVMTKHFLLETLDNRVFPGLDRPLTADEGQLYQYSVDLQRWSVERADRIIAVSRWMADMVGRIHPGAGEKCSTIHSGTDMHSQPPQPAPDAAQTGRTLLYVGRLRWKKGCDLALRALRLLSDPDCLLVFAGDGEYRPQLERLAAELGLEGRVRFLGFVDTPALAQLYREAAMVLVPSREEPFGLVASEAMSLGKLVVGARLGGIAEQIEHGVNGLLFEPGSAEDLAQQIGWALEHSHAAQQIADQAGAFARTHLTWDAVARRTVEQYRLVLGAY